MLTDQGQSGSSLARFEGEEKKRGRLKIFLSYAEGVGKTYAMLEAGSQRQLAGEVVIVAAVQTRSQSETQQLLLNLEMVQPRHVKPDDPACFELDIDAVLNRRPNLVLVDDLANDNPPGSRHPKRYQDVEELLDNGVNVYSTLNVGQLESLKDAVEQITGYQIHHTVPDRLLDKADVIELVDLSPDELIQRYQAGKIGLPNQGDSLGKEFFRRGNLNALREMAMRLAAARVDDQMRGYMASRAIPGPWPAADRIMVCISAHPLSERLVRAGRRLADESNARWFVVYVETPQRIRQSAVVNENVSHTINLAEELGAVVQKISARSIPEGVIAFARKENIARIIVGKPLRPRWQEFLTGSITDEIIRRSGQTAVLVISDESGPLSGSLLYNLKPHSSFRRYLISVLLVISVTFLGIPVSQFLHPVNLVMPYLAAVIVAAFFWGRGPSILASLLSVLAFDYFFIEPRLTLNVADTEYILTFLGLFSVGLVVSYLAGLVKDQVEALRVREGQTSTLYALSKDLTVLTDLDAVLGKVIEHISTTFGRDIAILLPRDGSLAIRAASPGFTLGESELGAAFWSYQRGLPAGRGTDTPFSAEMRYQPLRTAFKVVGVLGVKPGDPHHHLTLEQRQLLDAYASLAALAIERTLLAENVNQARVAEASERLQSALLNSISHDLRTPLVTVTGVLSSLFEEIQGRTLPMKKGDRIEMIQAGLEEAERLNRLLANLLDMSRLEGGALKLALESSDLEEIIGAALERVSKKLQGRSIKTSIPPDLPLVPVDFVLVEQVLINLLDNAGKYSPPGTALELIVENGDNEVRVMISDQGAGIMEQDLERIFDKFYRAGVHENIAGTGLGLSICKGIVESHAGRIWASNAINGGALITFTLPLKRPNPDDRVSVL